MIKCPICGKHEFQRDSDFAVCSVCGWENDGLQYDDPNDWEGANCLSQNEHKLYYELSLRDDKKSQVQTIHKKYKDAIREIYVKNTDHDRRVDMEKVSLELNETHEEFTESLYLLVNAEANAKEAV